MVGVKSDPGVIPRVCDQLFSRIELMRKEENGEGDSMRFSVEVSMIEIYNEKIRDLLNPAATGSDHDSGKGLKVREHPKTGPYVVDLARQVAHSKQEIAMLMDQGAQLRTIAKTNMNYTSSRAHTIFQIIFTQTRIVTSKNGDMTATNRVSNINLIDLAGSERMAKSGSKGKNVTEGIYINKSLSVLGKVISVLAERSKKSSSKHIPYRESILTWLLKESLGGNSKSIMIATISPASDNYNETLSTLRYAHRAKQIQNVASVNEDPNAKIINDLKEEIKLLKSKLQKNQNQSPSHGADIAQLDSENQELKEQLSESQRIIERLQMSFEQKQKMTQDINNARKKALTDAGISVENISGVFGFDPKVTPQLVNLNTDLADSECLLYFLKEGSNYVGRASSNDIKLVHDEQVDERHCILMREESDDDTIVKILPCNTSKVYVNGTLIEGVHILKTQDRIIIGSNTMFRYQHPLQPADKKQVIDWEYAHKEFLVKRKQEVEAEMLQRKLQLEQELSDLEAKKKNSISLEIQKLEARRQQLENNVKESELQHMQMKRASLMNTSNPPLSVSTTSDTLKPAAADKKSVLSLFKSKKKSSSEALSKDQLENSLVGMIPNIKRANAIAAEMRKNVKYALKIVLKNNLPTIYIQVVDFNRNTVVLWTQDFFTDRMERMKLMYKEFLSGSTPQFEDGLGDPFYHRERELLGRCRIPLRSIVECRHVVTTLDIIDTNDINFVKVGSLDLELACIHPTPIPFSEPPPRIESLYHHELKFAIRIQRIHSQSRKFLRDAYVSYELFKEPAKSTKKVSGKKVFFGYETSYHVTKVSKSFLKYLRNNELTLDVYGEMFDQYINAPSVESPSTPSRMDPRDLVTPIPTPLAPASPKPLTPVPQSALEKENEKLKRELEALRSSSPVFRSFKLKIDLFEASSLPASMNVYCKLIYRGMKKKTIVFKNTSNPQFSTSVLFDIPRDFSNSDRFLFRILPEHERKHPLAELSLSFEQLLSVRDQSSRFPLVCPSHPSHSSSS
eukprot:CAMPEP_0117419504 /NCGR_PEP_ID=MMETSP0758-20121206/1044_1 /TAXON_ID=63605 /ORGANISM="Percolomonas cosmopolitus, Strain AE-1 (ATCC 50343)" /LENGTH=1020 /DNA_ID=CAMNT_0005200591 /DNA_START=246 /DNA_END=3305 /DNA_ORIENTATION=-